MPYARAATFNPGKFAGTWFQFASYPRRHDPADAYNTDYRFQLRNDGSYAITTQYTLRGQVKQYQGVLEKTDQPFVYRETLQKAWLLDLLPHKQDFVLQLILQTENSEYVYALISDNSEQGKGAVTVLSRNPIPPCADQELLISILTQLGYDASKLHFTPQNCLVVGN